MKEEGVKLNYHKKGNLILTATKESME